MKKLLLLLFVVLLTACKPSPEEHQQVEELSFNGETYVYSDTTRAGFDLFNGEGHLLEVKYDEECIISFEIDEDIYIITGTLETYKITKNGSTILIDGSNQDPTGTESPEWNDDIPGIIEAYQN